MPILVQWKWEEKKGKTFLVIFHFYDDYSKPNMRSKRMIFIAGKPPIYLYETEDTNEKSSMHINPSQLRTVLTWAPSHLELGLLMELLSYANRINGLKESVKRDLIEKLTLFDFPIGTANKSKIALSDKVHAYGVKTDKQSGKEELVGCTELCTEYIEHLREILKPYL